MKLNELPQGIGAVFTALAPYLVGGSLFGLLLGVLEKTMWSIVMDFRGSKT